MRSFFSPSFRDIMQGGNFLLISILRFIFSALTASDQKRTGYKTFFISIKHFQSSIYMTVISVITDKYFNPFSSTIHISFAAIKPTPRNKFHLLNSFNKKKKGKFP